jgi:methanogenic corrinoid protein MtbC1
MADDLVTTLADLKEQAVLEIVTQRLDSGVRGFEILEDAARAMEIVGARFAEGDYFIPDLVYSGEIMRQISGMVKTSLTETDEVREYLGTFLIGTVAGDIHDIGKDIAAFMLEVSGFKVIDLGVDVPVQKFVEKIKETKPDIVGLCALLTVAFDSLKKTIDAISEAGLRKEIKIVIGGSQVDNQVTEFSGADAFCQDAMCGVILAREWISQNSDGKSI